MDTPQWSTLGLIQIMFSYSIEEIVSTYSPTLDFSERTKVLLRRIKYPDEMKSINDITPLMVLLKNQGAYIESIDISPELIQICNINYAILAACSATSQRRANSAALTFRMMILRSATVFTLSGGMGKVDSATTSSSMVTFLTQFVERSI